MALVNGVDFGFLAARPSHTPTPSFAGQTANMDSLAWGIKVVAPASAMAVTEIGWWKNGGAVDVNWECGIYTHDAANDRPGNLLTGASQTNSAGTTGSVWKYATGLNIAITAGVTYWICIQVDQHSGSTTTLYEQGVTGERRGGTSTGITTLPAGSAFTSLLDETPHAFYALYTAGGASKVPAIMNQYRQRR